MKIILKNENGEFSMGGGTHPTARITRLEGMGICGKECDTLVFESAPGRVTKNTRDIHRTITVSLDFYGGREVIKRLYRIIYEPLDIYCYLGGERRRISGRCINATDISNIIYRRWQSVVLQFVCDDPYFHDFGENIIKISTPKNHLPNYNSESGWRVELPCVATSIENSVIITNSGSTKSYPRIRIFSNKKENDNPEAPGIRVKNHTTGSQIEILYNPKKDDVITIDTGKRRVTSSVSGNITNTISDDTVLGNFFLEKGANRVELQRNNPNDIISCELEFTNNYIAAVI